jgi:hypothetical protein
MKYRFQWSFLIVFSPHDPKTLYIGSNVLMKTTNEGQNWEVISPDLTRNDNQNGHVGRAHHAGYTSVSTTVRSSRSSNRREGRNLTGRTMVWCK